MCGFKNLIFVILLLVLTNYKVQAQYNEYDLKSVFIYKFAQSLIWDEGHESDHFKIAVMKSDKHMHEAFQKNFRDKSVNGLPIRVLSIGYADLDTLKAHILFLSHLYNKRIDDITSMTANRGILRITDELEREDLVMINFIEDEDGINFEINPTNLNAEKIQVSQKLLMLGGNEIDVVNMNQELQERLRREIARVEAQTKKIEAQKKSLDEQLKVIGFQVERINYQRIKIAEQEHYLAEMERRIEEGKAKLEKQDLLLMQGQEALFMSKKRADAVNKNVEKYRDEIRQSQKTLLKLEEAIQSNRKVINAQKESLTEKEMTIKKHRLFLYMSIAAALLIALIAWFIYRNYRLKNRVNRVLSDKNEEITLQKNKLEEQTRVLDAANKRLAESNAQINAGIRYAMTIQSAVLPRISAIADYFKSFVLFRPKDYVSGDFFWANSVRKLGRDFFFAAVVDCTGHGVPGAFMSFVGNRLLNEIIVNDKEINPVRILRRMHEQVFEIFDENESGNRDGMVLSLIRTERIDEQSYNVLVSGAKQAVYIKDVNEDDIIRIRGAIKDIGSPHYEMVDFSTRSFVLHRGSLIYMLTDGLIDQNNPQRKKFGSARVKELLLQASSMSIDEQYVHISSELDSFMAGTEQRDDITLMGLKL